MMFDNVKRKMKRICEQQKWLSIREKTTIDVDSIFFESYSASNFQGNVFYIFKSFFHNSKFTNAVFYIASKSPEHTEKWLKEKKLYDERITIVQYLSDNYIRALYSSKYIFNNVTFPMNFVKKDEQIYINSWHGTPLKCIGKQAGNNPLVVQNMQRDFLSCDYLLSPNHITTEIYENDFNVKTLMKNDILEIGYPRNEIFYNEEYRKNERQRMNIDDKIVVFYMPTWRNNKDIKYNYAEMMENLSERLGNKYLVYIKLHPLDKLSELEFKNIRYMPEEYEVYEFLQCCDVLITDYSSVLFDFANTGRKIVLYQFDRSEYYNNRGIYHKIEEQIPFPVVSTIEDLERQIKAPIESYHDFVECFCNHDKDNPTDLIFHLLKTQRNDDICKECSLQIVGKRNELFFEKNNDMRIVLYLLPMKSNCFFENIENLDDLFFIVGSDKGQYTVKEYLLLFVYRFIKTRKLCSFIESVFERERRRMLGQLKVKEVIGNERIPKYLKSFVRR